MHNMNVLQLAEKYQGDCRSYGAVEAKRMLRALAISNALVVEIALCFDKAGNPLDFDMKQREYRFV